MATVAKKASPHRKGAKASRAKVREPVDPFKGKPLRRLVWDKTEGRCWYCGCHLAHAATGGGAIEQFCIDLVVSKAQGGASDAANSVPSCRSCRSMKRQRDIEEFRCYVTCHRHGIPSFTAKQLDWLAAAGFPVRARIKELAGGETFYFEREGLAL